MELPGRSRIVVLAIAVVAVIGIAVGVGIKIGAGRTTGNGAAATGAAPTSTISATSRSVGSPTTRPAGSGPTAPSGMATITVAALPAEGRHTLELIDAGGPFPHRQDGVVFQNREAHLPKRRSGYYHEYTVETPGSSDRGARRIVVGAPGERYYTDDHYGSFRFVAA